MIRNVVMGRLRDDLTDDERQGVEQALAGIAGLQLPGQLAMTVGRDLGLRDGGYDFAIVNDWQDEDAYRAYDLEDEHNRYRATVAAACVHIGRVQIRV